MHRFMDLSAPKCCANVHARLAPLVRYAVMGTVSSLQAHRLATRNRRRGGGSLMPPATMYFDLASPFTYLAAERAERMFPGLEWLPARARPLDVSAPATGLARADQRAAQLRLPLIWPEDRADFAHGAMRVASLAAERGCAGGFVLAASRLTFCGGFDPDHPEMLAEAASIAGIGAAEALAAAGDTGRDEAIEDAGRMLLAAGATRLPALRVGQRLFCGEDRLHEAAAARAAAL